VDRPLHANSRARARRIGCARPTCHAESIIGHCLHAPGNAADKGERPKTSSLADVVAAATLEEPRYPLEEQVEVVGETYRAKDIRRVFKEAGMPITESGVTLKSVRCILVPEPWNEHDPNAVAVMVGQNHVGYLDADLAASYTDGLLSIARLGSLATGEARIWAKSDDGIIRARVTILIPEASQFD
jgi:hypothetical protein